MKKIETRFFVVSSTLFALGAVLTGCGEAKKAHAPKNNVEAIGLQPLVGMPETLELNKTTLFLWKKEATPEQVAEVLKMGRLVDQMDDEAHPINQRIDEIKLQQDRLMQEISDRKAQAQKAPSHVLMEAKKVELQATIEEQNVKEKKEKPAKEKELKEKEAQLPKKKVGLEAREKDLATLEDTLKAKEINLADLEKAQPRDEEAIQALRGEIEVLKNKELPALQDAIKALKAEIKYAEDLKAEVAQIKEDIKNLRAKAGALRKEMLELNEKGNQELVASNGQIAELEKDLDSRAVELQNEEEKLRPITEKGNDAIKAISQNVDLYDPAKQFAFTFNKDGTVSVKITSWDVDLTKEGEDKRDFSTEDKTIVNVVYRPEGTVLSFDVLQYTDESRKEVRYIWTVKVSRTRYSTTDKDGRIFFSGDLFQKAANGEVLRQGVVKLADRKN